ncbi:hypothetical protein ABBQ32_009009 [Trebouxia sp. C0010 RCD-2024]
MAVRGYLTVLITQASSRTKANEVVWEDSFKDGFVKIEVRGGPRNVKVQSSLKPVSEGMLEWNETLHLEVLEESRELRIVLCREQKNGPRVKSSVVAACGIFVEDILDAVPIDKWFEMFKPAAAGEGGFIRVHMSFSEENPAHASNTSTLEPATPTENAAETRPGIAESFAPALSGMTAEMQAELQSIQKENRPPRSQGSESMPFSSPPVQRKTDEAQSRETSPDLPKPEIEPEPVTHTHVAHAAHYEHKQQPAVPQKKQKSKGNKAGKILSALLLIAAAGAGAMYYKQEMDKRPHTQHEILVVEDDHKGSSKKHHQEA